MKTKELPIREIRKLSSRDKAIYYYNRQKEWCESCEANGRSYAGLNGEAIRQADLAELKKLEEKMNKLIGK